MSFFVMPGRHWLFGFRVMIVSIMLRGALSVAVSARPAFPRTCSTSGTLRMMLSCSERIRATSVTEAFGSVTGIYRSDPSSSGGMNSDPIESSMGTVTRRAATLMAIVALR